MSRSIVMSRREFLRIIGVGSVAGGIGLKLGLDPLPRAQAVSETRVLMGTLVHLTLITEDRQAGETAVRACLDHMQTLEAILSRHRADSQLSRLNRDGVLEGASAHLVEVLRAAQRVSLATGGAFDVTVKPLVDLYQAGVLRGASLPGHTELEEALARVGYERLVIEEGRIAFATPGMGVTLDGIAKGYIVDEGAAQLRAHGFENVLVEAGGDLMGAGVKLSDAPWHIAIQAPRRAELLPRRTILVMNRAIATSGDYMQPYTPDLSVHHILDPRTGVSSPALASATVSAPACSLADALATALMVLGPQEGLAVLERFPDTEAYLVGKELEIWQSPGFALLGETS